jgi:hypothetical protein
LASESIEADNSENQFLAVLQRITAFAHKNKLAVAEELSIDAANIECLAPCTPAQEGMIYRFLGSDEALYFTTFNFTLDNSVDEHRLYDAWARAISQLQMLRTKFVLTNDGCAQAVLKEYKLTWNKISLHDPTEANIQETIQEQHAELSKIDKSGTLANPYSISIILTKNARVLSLNIFHALYDGISLPLLLHKVHDEYLNRPNIDYGPPFHAVLPYGPLAPIPNAEEFWRHALKGHQYHPVPRLRTPEILTGGKDTEVKKTLPANEIQHLGALRTKLGVTHQAIILAAWSFVIASIFKSRNVTQGIILSGRSFSIPSTSASTSTDAQNTIGPLLNTVPFYTCIKEGMSWKELLQSVHGFCVSVVAEGVVHTALRDVSRWCGAGSGDSGKGRELFDTLFVFQHEEKLDHNAGEEGERKLWTALPGEAMADVSLSPFLLILFLNFAP